MIDCERVMAKTVVIGGGTGFIGTALSKQLKSRGYNVVSISRKPGPYRLTWGDLGQDGLPANTSAVVSLGGQNFLDPSRRWTPGFKQNVIASRVNTTLALSEAIEKAKVKPQCFISISGVGYYPPSDIREYDESSQVTERDFLSKLALDWENAAQLAENSGVRQVIVRSGVVLGRQGGMIQQLYWPFFFGLGGRIGSGCQPLPWIHIDDIAGLLAFSIDNAHVTGVLNGVAPQMITNEEFTKAFASALRRPAFIPIPEFVFNFLFSAERAKVMTEGQKVFPRNTLATGYQYKYPDIISACRACSNAIFIDTT